MRSPLHRICRPRNLAALLWLLPAAVVAQTPQPTPTPVPREQDELDFGRLSVAIGSGARALGMGGAFLARPDDATASSWNPAGLSYLRAPEVSLVGVYNNQDLVRRAVDGTLQRVDETRGKAPDFLSLAVPLTIGATSGALQVSFQRVIPYTGERTIDEVGDPPKTVVGGGGFDVLALSTGLKLARWLRVGVSLNRWFNGFHQERERLLRRRSLQEVDFHLSGVSLNAGLILHPHETLNVGVVAKTRMSAAVKLTRSRVDFVTREGLPDEVTDNAHTSDDVRLDLPGAIGFGASWRPSSPLTLSSDYTRTFWSRSRIRNYFTLPAKPLGAVEAPPPDVFASLPFPNVLDEAQSDTEELRVGVEYVLITGGLKLPLRAGYVREKQYQLVEGRAPSLNGITAGAGLLLGPLLLDAAYVYQWGSYGDASTRVKTRLHRGLVSVIYRHGTGR